MRSPVPALVRTGFAGVLALAALAGCSKKTTAPGSLAVPEGQANGAMLMVGWPEQPSAWFTIADPATPETPSDDFVSEQGQDYWSSADGIRSATLDVSAANQLQVFRIGSDGNAQELFDYFLPPVIRIIGRDTDLYEFEDPAPGADPKYVSRGAMSGVITSASPVTNEVRLTGGILDDLDFLPAPKGAANDSVLNVQFTEDPRAAFYIVEINDGDDVTGSGSSFTLERRLRAIASPLLPGSRSLHSLLTLMPAGTGVAGFNLTVTSRLWPLTFYIRVTAYDYNGQMINRVNDYFRNRNRDGNLNLVQLEPLGGALEVLDPYPNPAAPVAVPDVLTRNEAFAIYNSVANSAPVQVANLRGQLTAGSAPSRDVFQRLSQLERFQPATLKADMAQIRQMLAAPPAAPAAGRSASARRR